MKDKSQNDLEIIFERHYIRKEAIKESTVSSRLASKSIERVISVIVSIVDLGGDVSQGLIDRVVDENKTGQLIAALQEKGLAVPAEIAHAIEVAGEEGLGDEDELGGDIESEVHPDRIGAELSFDEPKFGEIEDEEDDKDKSIPSYKLDPSMR